ncbi:hypothetical protein HPP92_028301 [Vanilla planifolia]|uniref:Uncharacterized protein n=1 Tax=Vanilla planifolia TaxID=51239 RepID=A0A835P640_VANPL|nr:hypothetical protein HPP92_028301 [Vanilla planifolia]
METMKNENLLLLTRNDNLNQVLECNNEELSNLGQALKATEFERDTLTEEKFALLGKINEGVAIHVELKAQIEQVEGSRVEDRQFQTQFGVLNEQNSILQSKVQEAEKDANDLKFERDGVIADNKKLQNKVEELKLKIHDLDLQLHAANLQLSDMNNAALAAEEEKRALLAENSIVKSKLQEIESKVEEAEKDKNDLKFERDGVIADNKRLENKVEELKLKLMSKVQEAEKDANDLKFERDGPWLPKKKRALLAENSIVKSKLQEIESKVEEAEKDKNDLKFERDGVIADNKKLETKVEELKLKINGNRVEDRQFQTQFGVLNEQNSILQSKVQEAEKDANDLKFERDGVIADNKKLENKVEELKLKIHDLDLQLHANFNSLI